MNGGLTGTASLQRLSVATGQHTHLEVDGRGSPAVPSGLLRHLEEVVARVVLVRVEPGEHP